MTTPSGTGNTAPSLTTATVLLYLWALLSFAVRVWVRLRKNDNWGLDDTSISFAALSILGNVIAVCYGVNHGYGNSWSALAESDDTSIRQSLYTSQILYVFSIGVTRISASFFTARFLTRDRSHDLLANVFTGLCGLWTCASVLLVAVRAPYLSPWLTLQGSYEMFIRWLVLESLGIVVDLCTIAVSVYLVWTLQMAVGKRIAVCAIFSCRLLVIPLIVLRLVYLHPSQDRNYDIKPDLRADLVMQGVLNATFILSSITCLKPFLRPFNTGYSVSTVDPTMHPTGWEKPSKSASSKRDTLYELSSTSTSKRGKTLVSVQSRAADGDWEDEQDLIQPPHSNEGLVLRPDRCVERKTAISGGRAPYGDFNEQDGIMVSKTAVWNITYE